MSEMNDVRVKEAREEERKNEGNQYTKGRKVGR